MKPTTQMEITKLIHNLPNKSSHGHDMISNELLKSLNKSISYPLLIIFNQLLGEGIFPNLMKLAEVIPLYKGKESNKVVNYRSISLLLTISKVLEKIVYKRLNKFITKSKILYDSQYGFQTKCSCEHTILELTGSLLQARNKKLHSASLF